MTKNAIISANSNNLVKIFLKNIVTIILVYGAVLSLTFFYFTQIGPTYRAKIEISPASPVKSIYQRRLESISDFNAKIEVFNDSRNMNFNTDLGGLFDQERLLDEFIHKLRFGGQLDAAIESFTESLQISKSDPDYLFKVAKIKRGMVLLQKDPLELAWYLSVDTKDPETTYNILKTTFDDISHEIGQDIQNRAKIERDAKNSIYEAAFVSVKSDLEFLMQLMEQISGSLNKNQNTMSELKEVPVINLNGRLMPLDNQSATVMAVTLRNELQRLKDNRTSDKVSVLFFESLQGLSASIPKALIVSDLDPASFKSTRNKPIALISMFLLATLLLALIFFIKENVTLSITKS